jgi:NADH-quinone oxidoreductase subunit G
MTKPQETFGAINDGRTPHLLMDIHDESEVNKNQDYISKNNIENA